LRVTGLHEAPKVSDKPRLLVLTSSFPRDPADETCAYVAELARRLSGRFQVTILAPADRDAASWPQDSFELVRSESLVPSSLDRFQASRDLNDASGCGLAVRMAMAVSVASYLLRALKLGKRTDIILSHWLVPGGLIGAAISWALRKPHVVLEHSGGFHLLSRIAFGRLFLKFISKRSAEIAFVSDDLRQSFQKVLPHAAITTRVIRLGVDVPAFERIESAGPSPQIEPVALHQDSSAGYLTSSNGNPPSILFIGRLTRIKGVDVLIRAAKQIPGTRLVIAGDGPSRKDLQELAHNLSINAVFLGRIGAGERLRLLKSCDVVAIPSLVMPDGRREGTPLVCLEAMAAGCPVVASRTGGLAEVIEDGRNGFLFDPGDNDALALKLELLLSNVAIRERLVLEARATAIEFDWPLVTSRVEQALKSSLEHGSINHHPGIQTRRAGV
jgi:glycosyltransferase involved in cell wall biosynthesis